MKLLWLVVVAIAVAILALVVIQFQRGSGCSSSCSSSSSSSSSNSAFDGCGFYLGFTGTLQALLDAGMTPAANVAFAPFGSADAVYSKHHAPGTTHAPHVRNERNGFTSNVTETGVSANWSGYASVRKLGKTNAGTVTRVEGTWTVPTVTGPASGSTYSSIWPGIDGFTSNTVEQCGTEQDYVSGTGIYFAWFEMFPLPSYEILNFPILPGHSITGTVTYLGDNLFQLVLINNTLQTFVIVPEVFSTVGAAQRSSAEWIVEAPSSGGVVLPLASFTPVTFSEAHAWIGPGHGRKRKGSICSPCRDDEALTLETGGVALSTPSSLSLDCESFTVTRSAVIG